jgi:hypothetical protein
MASKNRLDDLLPEKLDDRYVSLQRNGSLGGAATALVVFAQILQVGATTDLLRASLILCCIAMALFVLLGTCLETILVFGKETFAFLLHPVIRVAWGIIFSFAGLSLLGAVATAVWHLLPLAGTIFVGVAIACTVAVAAFFAGMEAWIFRKGGPRGPTNPPTA